MNYVQRSVVLQTLDNLWREHIVNLDHLRSVVGFRGYAQRDPLQEYKSEAFELFQALLVNLREAVTAQMMRVELVRDASPPQPPQTMEPHHIDATTGDDEFAGGNVSGLWHRTTAIRPTRKPGAVSGATKPAPVAPARSTSIATAPSNRKREPTRLRSPRLSRMPPPGGIPRFGTLWKTENDRADRVLRKDC